jgi:hypothetical protein
MKTLLVIILSFALAAAMAAAYAGGKTSVDPTVAGRKMQDGGGTTKPKATGVGTQPAQKPAGGGGNSRAPQR